MVDAPDERRLEMPCTDEPHHGALRVRIRNHGVAVEDLSVLRFDAGHSTVLDHDAANRRARTYLRTGITGGLSEERRHHAHAAFRQSRLAAITRQSIQVRQHCVG